MVLTFAHGRWREREAGTARRVESLMERAVRTDAVLSTMALCPRRLARSVQLFFCALAALAILLSPAFADREADRRVALVIGDGAYRTAPRLDDAVLDAGAIANAFRRLGFTVVEGYDLGIAGMRATAAEFSGDLPGAKSAVVYTPARDRTPDQLRDPDRRRQPVLRRRPQRQRNLPKARRRALGLRLLAHRRGPRQPRLAHDPRKRGSLHGGWM